MAAFSNCAVVLFPLFATDIVTCTKSVLAIVVLIVMVGSPTTPFAPTQVEPVLHQDADQLPVPEVPAVIVAK